jgi:hypothetical protein
VNDAALRKHAISDRPTPQPIDDATAFGLRDAILQRILDLPLIVVHRGQYMPNTPTNKPLTHQEQAIHARAKEKGITRAAAADELAREAAGATEPVEMPATPESQKEVEE